MEKTLKQVEEYWDSHLCGSEFIEEDYLSKEFFDKYREFRYKKEHHILRLVDFKSAEGKDVLEIGLGVGADSTNWAKYAKSFTGVDLTNEAVKATRKHFQLLNLQGNIMQGNAEALDLPDKSFDIVYSHGVLHHSENIMKTFAEVNRVLRPDGQFILMLYSKSSFNYWIRIQMLHRARIILENIKNKFGFKSKGDWAEHIDNLKKYGWKYLSWNELPHHCTDGPRCNIANIYYTNEAIKMLKDAGFRCHKTVKTHFPITNGNNVKLENFLAPKIGFFQFFWTTKI
ncbi:MAG: methyltransferase domain-containing protein [Ignavibacteria bacterium]|nr:methyltransferase domain-containing protein [Ignavibacteria bacterium]